MENSLFNHTNPAKKGERLKTDIMALFGWDEMEYNNYQFEQGCQYLEHYFMLCPFPGTETRDKWRAKMERCASFWLWWKLRWTERNENFLRAYGTTGMSRAMLIEVYTCINDGRVIASDVHPARMIMHESYEQLLKEGILKE